jgi:hypothetical protein
MECIHLFVHAPEPLLLLSSCNRWIHSNRLVAQSHALLLLLTHLSAAALAAAVAKTISQFEPVTMWTDPSVVEEAKQYLADAPNVTGELLIGNANSV